MRTTCTHTPHTHTHPPTAHPHTHTLVYVQVCWFATAVVLGSNQDGYRLAQDQHRQEQQCQDNAGRLPHTLHYSHTPTPLHYSHTPTPLTHTLHYSHTPPPLTQFDETMIVYDACRLIRERVPDAASGQRKSL